MAVMWVQIVVEWMAAVMVAKLAHVKVDQLVGSLVEMKAVLKEICLAVL